MPTPWNNPYIPGDPYSYDLKWIVRKIKEHSEILIDIDEKIANAIIAYLDQHDPMYYKTAAEMIASTHVNGDLCYIEGFHNAGDGGANLYYITGDYYEASASPFFLTLASANQWAVPIIMTYYVTPEMFGAYGDGSSDDTTAFQIFCNLIQYDQIAPKSYKLTSPCTIADKKSGVININTVSGNMVFDSVDNCEISVISIGSEYNGGHIYTGSEDFNFGQMGDIGIQFIECYSNNVSMSSYNHEIGVQLTTRTRGCVYNKFQIKAITNNVVGLDLYNGGTGWVNENTFNGGSYSNSTDNPHKTENVGIRFGRGGNNTNTLNSNTFYKPSFEMWGMPILGEHAVYNTFELCRAENQTSMYARFDKTSQYNKITYSYSTLALANQPIEGASVNYNLAVQRYTEMIVNGFVKFFEYEFKKNEITYVQGSNTRYLKHVKGLDTYYIGSGGATLTPYYNKLAANCFEDTNGIIIDDGFSYGLMFECYEGLKIGMDATLESGTIRFSVNCYDASMSPVAVSASDFSGEGWSILSSNQIGSNSNTTGFFHTLTILNSNIKYIAVAVRTYQSAVLSSLRFYAGSITDYYWYKPTIISNLQMPFPLTKPGFIKYGVAGEILPATEVTTGTDSTGTYYITGYVCTADGNNWQALKSYV